MQINISLFLEKSHGAFIRAGTFIRIKTIIVPLFSQQSYYHLQIDLLMYGKFIRGNNIKTRGKVIIGKSGT